MDVAPAEGRAYYVLNVDADDAHDASATAVPMFRAACGRHALDGRGARIVDLHAQLAPDNLRAAIDEAHKKGLRTISHTGRTNALEAVLAGTNILTHLVGVADKECIGRDRIAEQRGREPRRIDEAGLLAPGRRRDGPLETLGR